MEDARSRPQVAWLTDRHRDLMAQALRGAEAFLAECDERDRRMAEISALVESVEPIGEQFRRIAEEQTRAIADAMAANADRVAASLERAPRPRSRRSPKPSAPILPADCARLVAELERLTEERIDVPTDGRTPAATRYMLQRRLAEEKCRRDGKRPGVLGLYLVALDRIEPEIRGAMPEPKADRERSPAEWTRQAARCADSWARKGRDAIKRTSRATRTPERAAR